MDHSQALHELSRRGIAARAAAKRARQAARSGITARRAANDRRAELARRLARRLGIG